VKSNWKADAQLRAETLACWMQCVVRNREQEDGCWQGERGTVRCSKDVDAIEERGTAESIIGAARSINQSSKQADRLQGNKQQKAEQLPKL